MANLLSDDDVFGSAPSGLLSDADVFGKGAKTEPGGFVASAKQAIGATVKGAGQAAADFIPGVSQENALKRYGQEIIEANPTAVHSFSDLANKPWTAVKEATGNALSSMGGVVGSRALGMGITAAAPFTGPAAPVVAGAGQAISWLGPVAAAALPSFGGIREQQIHDDPNAANSAAAKAAAAVGAGTVGAIESRFGPEAWGSKMLTEAGRKEVAKLFAAKTLPQAVAKGAVRGAAVEGAEELAQNPVEQLAAFQNPLTAEALKDTAFSGAMGALGGGVLGGGTGAASRYLPKKPDVDPGNQPAEPPKALPAPTYTGTPGDQTLQATVDRQNAVDAAQAAADTLYNESDAFERERAANMGTATHSPNAPIRYEPGLISGVDVGGPTEPPSPPGGGIDFTPPQLPDTGPLSRAANLALGASVPMERQAFFPFQSFAAAERMRNGRDDLVTRQHPSIPGRFTLVPAGLETPVARQAKPDVQQGTGSFSDQNELANFIADERKDQSARKAALAEGKNNAIAQADQAVADARQFATRNERLSILDGVLSSLAPGQNPNRRFDAALKAAGFRDTSFTEEERAVIGRYGNVASAFAVAPEASVEPSSPGEIEAAIPAAKGKGDSGIAGVRADRVRSAIAAGFTQRKGFSLINPATGEKFALKTPGMIRAAKEALEQSNPTTEIKSEAVGLDHESGSQQRPDQDGSRGNMPTVRSIDGGDRPASGAPAPGSEPAVSVGDGSGPDAALSRGISAARPRGPESRDDLLGAILRVTGGNGISARIALTVIGDTANRATRVRGLFTNRGTEDLDDTAELLRIEEGYDVRDGNHLAELIREQASGNPVHSMRRMEAEIAANAEREYKNAEREYKDEVRRRAAELGIRTVAVRFDAIERAVVEAETKLAEHEANEERLAIQAEYAMFELDDDQVNFLLEISAREDKQKGKYLNGQWISNEEFLNAFEPLEASEDEQGDDGAGQTIPGEAGGSHQEGSGAPGARQDFGLTGQTNAQASAQFAQQNAAESNVQTKEQADRERDAVPFFLAAQSQPKPQGVQSGLFTADGRVSVEAKQPEKPAEVTKPKNEQQETAGLPAATDGGSRPVPAVPALEETYRPLIERLIRNKRVAKELGFDIDGAIAKAKAAMAGTKQMPGSFRALAKRAEKKGDTETAAILNQVADLNDGRKAKATVVKDSLTTEPAGTHEFAPAPVDRKVTTEDARGQQDVFAQQAKPVEQSAQDKIKSLQKQLKKATPFEKREADLNGQLIELVTKDAEQAISDGTAPAYRTGDSTFAIIHPSAQKDGMIQVTRYNEDGVFGDSQYSDIESAVRGGALWFRPRMSNSEAVAALDASAKAEEAYRKRREAQPVKATTEAKAVEPAKYKGPDDVSTRSGQMELANRAGTIAALKAMNAQLRSIDPTEAWNDKNIEEATDLDSLRDRISEALVKANRGKQPEENADIRKALDDMSGAELKAVFDKLNLAGSRMTVTERIDALMAEDASEVRAAISEVTGQNNPAAVDAKKEAETDDGIRYSKVSDAPAGEELVAIHNLTSENVLHAAAIGGIPVPSIGITKLSSPFTDFGEITLIADKGMIDPENSVPVFDRDAYTARFPEFNYKKVTAKKADAFYERMNVARELGDDGQSFISQLWDAVKNARVQSPKKVADLFRTYLAPRMLYAKEVLGKEIKAPMIPIKASVFFGHEKSWRDFVKNNAELKRTDEDAYNAAAAKAIKIAANEFIDRASADNEIRSQIRSAYMAEVDRYAKDSVNWNYLDRAIKSAQDFGKKRVDAVALSNRVAKIVPQDDPGYLRWVSNEISDLFVAPTITLRGKEVEASLDNIVEAMTIGKTNGAEKTMTFGVGKTSALLGKRFKSIKEIQDHRNQVVSSSRESEMKKDSEKLLEEYRLKAVEHFTHTDWKGRIDTFAGFDAAMEALAKAGKGALTDGNIASAMRSVGFKNVPNDVINLARQGIVSIREASTDYFEAKPQRAVKLNEFNGAVVPNGTNQEVIDALKASGITDIRTYKRGDEEGRKKSVALLAKKIHAQNNNTLFSNSAEGATQSAPITRTEAESRIKSILGDKLGKVLIDSGIVTLVDNVSQLKNLAGAKFMVAWHGSPHDHDKFDSSKIGTGEGAQAYGYGLYFAGSRDVAEYYKETLTNRDAQGYANAHLNAKNLVDRFNGDAEWAAEVVSDQLRNTEQFDQNYGRLQKTLEFIKSGAYAKPLDNPGKLYQVELAPSEDEYLDWDKPLSEQSELVRSAIESNKEIAKRRKAVESRPQIYTKSVDAIMDMTGQEFYELIANAAIEKAHIGSNGEYVSLPNGFNEQKAASDYLHSIGIRGIRYLDGTSRSAGQGNSNYVIFSDDDVSITAKYAKQDGDIQGATLPDGRIALVLNNLNADNFAGVFAHEGFHSTIRDLVGEPTYAKLMKQLENMQAIGNGSQWFKNANAAIPADTKAENRTEELAAYAVEQHINGAKQPNIITRWVESLLSALRTAIIRRLPFGKLKSWAVNNLQPQDLANLAIAGLKAKARGQLQAQGREATAYSTAFGKDSQHRTPLGDATEIEVDGIKRPALNSNGKPIHWSREGVENFWRWFSDSKAVDAEGRPLVVYHGTSAEFNAFDTGKGGSVWNDDASRAGIFFGSTKDDADHFGAVSEERIGGKKRVLQAYLAIKRPKIITDDVGGKYVDEWLAELEKTDPEEYDYQEATKAYENSGGIGKGLELAVVDAKQSGRDGAIVRMEGSDEMYVVFSPTQIKSATENNGDFSPDNPDIRYSKASQANNNGGRKYSKINQTDTPAFKKWFGDSKVVDADGKPLVVYHGTTADVAQFDLGFSGSDGVGYNVPAIFATTDKKLASDYAINKFDREIADAMRAMQRFKNENQGDYGDEYERLYQSVKDAFSKQRYEGRSELGGGANVIPLYMRGDMAEVDANGQRFMEVMPKALLNAVAQGKDGVIVNNVIDNASPATDYPARVFVTFAPENVKSAIGNNGNFDGTNPDIRYSRAQIIGDSGRQSAFDIPESSKMDDVIYAMQDKQVDLRRVVQSIKKAGGNLTDSNNAYLQEELFHGRAAKAVKDFLDLELRPLIAEMRMRGVGMADFEEYLWNRHAEERNAQIAKINPQMEDGGSGLKTADAQAYLAGLSSDKRKAYELLAAKIDAITAKNRQVLVESGLEKAETVAAWEGAYKHYVPLQREDVETGGNGTGQGFSVRGTSSKRAVGSGRPVADIIANLAMQRERFIVKAEKNRVSIAIAGLAASNPNPDFWKLNEAPKERVVNNVAIYNVLDANGNKVADFTRMDEAERMAMSMGGEVEQTWDDRVQERIVPGFKNQENVVHFRLNGEDHFVIFNEREPRAMRMAQSIKNLDMDQLGRVLTVAGKVTRYFAAINTQYNPIFGIINLFRDVQGALLNLSTTPLAGEQKRVAGYTVDALRGIYADIRAHRAGKVPSSRWAKLYEEFQNEGGQTGYRDQFSNAEQRAEAIAKEIKAMDRNAAFKAAGAVFDWLSDYNQAMENAVRLAAYAAAKERGLSKQQAASLAKNLTVNFNRKGQVATQMGALYAFFNASMQGTARLAQTLTGPMGRRIITGGVLLGSMQAMLLASAGMGDDEPPEFVRERNLILPIGDGKYISLPMPLGFHVLPNLGRIPTEFVMSGFREPARRISDLVGIFADAFNPIGNAGLSLQTIAPTVVDPFAALAENKDWTGKPIAKLDMNANAPTPGHSRAKDTATAWSKAISEAINYLSGGTRYKPGAVSPTPDQIDYLIGQVTGGVGREAAKVEQTATSMVFTGEDLPLHKVPLVGRFVGDTKGQSAEGSKFYAALKRINEHENEIKGMRKDGRGAEVAEYIRENPDARLVLYGNHVEREVQKLRSAKRDALERGDAGRVRMIESALTAKMRAFNERVRSAQGSNN